MSVLVLCTGNSARSQLAEGFLQSRDPDLEVHSAGTEPARRVNPYAVRAMEEIGIDISGGKPKHVRQFRELPFDCVVTVCGEADESCPILRGRAGKRLHIGFPDPAKATGSDERIMTPFRQVGDDIRKRFKEFHGQEIRKA